MARTLRRICLIAAGLIVATAALGAPDYADENLIVGQIGLHCPYRTSEKASPDTEKGSIGVIKGRAGAVEITTRVPALLGLAFGVQASARRGHAFENATIIVRHPPMGRDKRTEQSWQLSFFDYGWSLTLYRFEFPEELQTGTWSIEIVSAGKSLLRQTFEVVAPGQGETLSRLCGDATS